MKITYDEYADAMYIYLDKKSKSFRTQEITDDLLVDFSKDGKVIGIEILDARENVSNLKPGKVNLEIYDERHATTV